MARIRVSPSRLEAFLVLEEGERVSPVEAMALLGRAGVIYGLAMDRLMRLDAAVGPFELAVAAGAGATNGRDAVLRHHFRTAPPSLAPRLLPGGRADYRELGLIECVQAGQTLAEREPPVVGCDGVTVLGERLAALAPRNRVLRAGEGCMVSEDGSRIVATRAGAPALEGGVVHVRKFYRVAGDVGLATGHVRFDGDVEILGDVETDMVVEATGRVVVRGSVTGARVTSGASAVIHGKALAGATIEAGGALAVGLVEYATLSAKGDMTVREDLLHAIAVAHGDVAVGGALVGGVVTAAGRVSARVIGSPMGVPTRLEIDPEAPVREELAAIALERARLGLVRARLSERIREAAAQGEAAEVVAIAAELRRRTEEDERLTAAESGLHERVCRHFAPVTATEAIHPEVAVRLPGIESPERATLG